MHSVKLTFENISKVSNGDTIICEDRVFTAKFDLSYNGGYSIGGVSLRHMIENYDDVLLVTRL